MIYMHLSSTQKENTVSGKGYPACTTQALRDHGAPGSPLCFIPLC